MRSLNWIVPILALLLPATTALAGDFAAADFTLPTVDGERIGLHEELADGPVVVSFWATWCIPCLKEMPHLDALAAEYAGRVSFIAVNVDNSRSVAKVAPLIRSRGWENLRIALDTSGEVQQLLQVVSPPYIVVYDGGGSDVYRHEGYKDGDEVELRHAIESILTAAHVEPTTAVPLLSDQGLRDAVTATDQFRYRYSQETEEEVTENWLDVSYQLGGFRTGLTLNHQAPSEEDNRRNRIIHRFFEFNTGRISVRAGQFYGLFGRGLVWNSYENRFIRVDTALDGVIARGNAGPATFQVLSGATGTVPTVADTVSNATQVDVRGVDIELRRGEFMVGGAGLTYLPVLDVDDGVVRREWVGTARAGYNGTFGNLYLEYGQKTGYEFDPNNEWRDPGVGFYGNLGLFAGPFSFSLERSDYDNFTVLKRVDGKQPLNRPPALVREHLYALLNRKPHNMNQDDEKGWQLEVNADLGEGRTLLVNGSRIETHNREVMFEEGYAQLEQSRIGDFRVRGAFGYQEGEGSIRQTTATDITWYQSEALAWSAQAEHQHVRLGVLGEYDQQWLKLELELPPRWTLDAIFEVNNKYDPQFEPGEIVGKTFPAGQVTYTLDGGGNLNVWFGKRQAGYLCSGGVCKFEPAFEGVEFFGVFRY